MLLLSTANPAGAARECPPACRAVQACTLGAQTRAESDAWLLLAGLVVAAAGRLAAHPRR